MTGVQTCALPIYYGTIIDFQIEYDKKIAIEEVFGQTEPYEPFFRDIDEMMNDYNSHIIINLKKKQFGTTSRDQGKQLRLFIMNLHRGSKQKIVIDFDTVSIITSSFSDECFGKLSQEIGGIEILESITLINLDDDLKRIINHAIFQRKDKNI